jgi:DNA-binding response OmpR family regulator
MSASCASWSAPTWSAPGSRCCPPSPAPRRSPGCFGGPDLVVLDLGLPDVADETVAGELRANGTAPILSLTARSAEEDRIAAWELASDDYVTKPVSPRELVLRVQAILRRGTPASEQGVTSYGTGLLEIYEPRRLVTVRGAAVEPTDLSRPCSAAATARPAPRQLTGQSSHRLHHGGTTVADRLD